jgi:Rhodopirellula transposase DDE domain
MVVRTQGRLSRDLEELLINLDGGSATRSDRTQFIKRIVQLAKSIGIRIRLVYYPPYHSKYNPIVIIVIQPSFGERYLSTALFEHPRFVEVSSLTRS